MRLLHQVLILLSGVASVLSTGCHSVPLAGHDEEAAVKKFEPEPGMSRIYVYKNYGFAGFAGFYPVTINE